MMVLCIQPVHPVVQFFSSLVSFLAIPFTMSCCGLNRESLGLERTAGYLARMGSSAEVQNLWQCDLDWFNSCWWASAGSLTGKC